MTDTIRLRMPGTDTIVTVSAEKAARMGWQGADRRPADTLPAETSEPAATPAAARPRVRRKATK